MIQSETIRKLIKLTEPRTFKEQGCICFEGQPGNEMYIILRGSVGVYVNSVIGRLVEVTRITAGDFFGEMSIFDSLPRSATCIALEETVCVSINKDCLADFLSTCPELAVKLLENMSGRIRRMDNELYKTYKFAEDLNVKKFEIPAEYASSHSVQNPNADDSRHEKYLEKIEARCPICSKSITVTNLKRQLLTVDHTDPDGRIRYAEFEPLWNEIWECPHCRYSNHYPSFFKMLPFKRDHINKLLTEQHIPAIEKAESLNSEFDKLFISYLQAIHINEAVNKNDGLLLGRLWLDLYWLSADADDETMKKYCSEKALKLLKTAYEENAIPDDNSKQSIALTIANLSEKYGSIDDAKKYCALAVTGKDVEVRTHAQYLRDRLQK